MIAVTQEADEQFHRANQADGAVILVNERARAIVGADDEHGRAVRVHVIGAVLRVVFENENRRVLPVGACGNFLNEKAERVVVVRNVKLRRRHIGT